MTPFLPFKEILVGSYFRSVFTNALFVKRNNEDAAAIKLDGLADPYELDFEFDPTTSVHLMSESEWPTIDYTADIRAWKWDLIKEKANANYVLDHEESNPKATAWIGTTFGVMPSGKIYAMWTSNQTDEDVNRDQAFNEALEIVAKEQGMYVDWNDSNDLFMSRYTTFEEIAKEKGYRLEEEGDRWYWIGDDNDAGETFDTEDEAWSACCIENRLVQE